MEVEVVLKMYGPNENASKHLQPANPWILGLFGFAGATFMVAGHLAGWYGGPHSDLFLFPFVAVLGLVELLAGMWAFRAGDGMATAMHGIWGAFWMAWGALNFTFAWGHLTEPTGAFAAMGFWFIVMAGITWMLALASFSQSGALATVFVALAAGCTLEAIARLTGANGGTLDIISGWLFVISSVCAWYTASAFLLEETSGHAMLGIGRSKKTLLASSSMTGSEPAHQH